MSQQGVSLLLADAERLYEAYSSAIMDAVCYGSGFLRVNPSGTIDHIPADKLLKEAEFIHKMRQDQKEEE